MTKRTTLTIKEVAQELGMSDEHVRRLVRSGELSGFNIGTGKRKIYRVRQAALDELVKTREIRGKES